MNKIQLDYMISEVLPALKILWVYYNLIVVGVQACIIFISVKELKEIR